MQTGKIQKWYKNKGDYIAKGETLLEVIADKAVMQVESPISGYVLHLCYKEGDNVPVSKTVAFLGEEGENFEQVRENEVVHESDKDISYSKKGSVSTKSSDVKATPVVKAMAKKLNIDLRMINGSGLHGMITKSDIETYLEGIEEQKDDNILPLEGARKVMAEKMSISKHTAAHATTVAEVDMSNILYDKDDKGYSITAAIVWASAAALKDYPLLNSSLNDDKIILHKEINISVAVSTGKNLVTPILRKVDTKDIQVIDQEIKALAEKAKKERLMTSDLEGGTFTVTNSGVFGSLFFMPIINYPQSAIIGMGKIMKTPVVRDEQIVIRPMIYLSLSYDHRFIEGETAVTFLQSVKKLLETY